MEKRLREDTRFRDSLICTLRDLIKTSSYNVYPKDPCRTCPAASVSEFICVLILFPWCAPFTLALILFLHILLWGSLNPEGKDLMETALLGLGVSRSFTLCIVSCLWASVFVSLCCKRKILWLWLSKVLIYAYSRILLGVILFKSSVWVFSFTLRPWAI